MAGAPLLRFAGTLILRVTGAPLLRFAGARRFWGKRGWGARAVRYSASAASLRRRISRSAAERSSCPEEGLT